MLDRETRAVLRNEHLHYKTASSIRLYLPRNIGGRGSKNIEALHDEAMWNMYVGLGLKEPTTKWQKLVRANEGFRRNGITKIEETVRLKYGPEAVRPVTQLKKLWIEESLRKEEEKYLHSKYRKALNEPIVSKLDSILWLKDPSIGAKSEAKIVNMQDGNMYSSLNVPGLKCPMCKDAKLTTKHVSTECPKLLNTQYKARHDEVARYIHYQIQRMMKISVPKH